MKVLINYLKITIFKFNLKFSDYCIHLILIDNDLKC